MSACLWAGVACGGSDEETGEGQRQTEATEAGDGTAAETATISGGETDGETPPPGIGPAVCDNPTELLQPSGAPSGFVRCANGIIERVAAVECEPIEVGSCDEGEDAPQCSTAEECGENGICSPQASGAGVFCQCRKTCRVDADCGEGAICACSPLLDYPRCVSSRCTTSSDCGGESLCNIGRGDDGCGARYAGACTRDDDVCRVGSDCDDYELCLPSAGEWGCQPGSCE